MPEAAEAAQPPLKLEAAQEAEASPVVPAVVEAPKQEPPAIEPGEPLKDGDEVAAASSATAAPDDVGGEQPVAKRQRRESVGSQLLETLSTELGLTASQVESLSGQKGFIQSERDMKGRCLHLIRELRTRIAEHISTSQSITDCLRRILTPVQVAKFLMWVEKNQTAMDLLNTMLHAE